MTNKLRNPICNAKCRNSRHHSHNDQGGSGFLDSLKNVFSGAKNLAFGEVGTAISNAVPDSDDNARPLFPGEVHTVLKLPNGKMGRANFMGPGTKLVQRLKRGDPPRTFSDKESQAHDARYWLAKSPDDVKRADLKMIDVMKRGKKNNLDAPMNIAQGLRIIQAKNKIENITGKNLVNFGPNLGDTEADRPLVEGKLAELEKQGFGKNKPPGHKLKNKLIRQYAKSRKTSVVPTIPTVRLMYGKGNPITSVMEYLSTKAGQLMLPFVKKYLMGKYNEVRRNTGR